MTDDQIQALALSSGFYPDADFTMLVRAIEQAARMEALESALGICAAVMTDSMNKDGEAACEACMVAIRALMGEEG